MRAVVFDLDGTLIDSDGDILAALNRTLAGQDLPLLSQAQVKSMIGDGAKVLVERAFALYGKTAGPADLAVFLADYEENSTVETVPYPGMKAALSALRDAGHVLAVCTNKPEGAARRILDALGLGGFFSVVTGGDTTRYKKPDPRHLAATLEALGVQQAIMVGDHENDMAAARGLALPSIFAAWGYGKSNGTVTAYAASEVPGLVAALDATQ
jgi:phosphoglycolate phosphatase